MAQSPLCLALTMGDPTGVGPELTLKAWLERRSQDLPSFLYVGNSDHLKELAERLTLDVPIVEVDDPKSAQNTFERQLPVVNVDLGAPVAVGQPDARHTKAVVACLDRAIALTSDGLASGIVTNPIHKKTMWDGGFGYPGHTEYLAAKASAAGAPADVIMMLMVPELRVVPVTIHIPLKDVSAALNVEDIVRAGKLTDQALRADFGIDQPKLGVAALNPHGGEDDGLGIEERTIIAPAIATLCEAGIDAVGPFPADTLFSAQSRKSFDAIICMYHDQALIPLKAIDFDRGINVTLGLPVVRTSPDHGTAHDIAGQGTADPQSLIAALKTAHEIAGRREER